MMGKLLPHKDEIIRLFEQEGWGYRSISKKFECDPKSIKEFLLKHRGDLVVKIPKKTARRFDIDVDYFTPIDTERKAYFFGLLMADGYIPRRKDRPIGLAIELVQEDAYLLMELAKDLRYEGRLNERLRVAPDGSARTPTTTLYITSEALALRMVQNGMEPRKSLTAKLPPTGVVPDHLMWHFIRGLFDGDGSIFRSDFHSWRATITSAAPILHELSDMLTRSGVHNVMRNSWSKKTNEIYISRVIEIKKFHDLIYQDASIWMHRKRDRFDECFSSMEEVLGRRSLQVE